MKLHQCCDLTLWLRDNNNLQQSNRKLERKVKEMKMQADDEHVNLQSERDQVRWERRAPQAGAAGLAHC